MRELVYQAVSNDVQLQTIGEFATLADLAAATYGSNSVDDPTSRPFIVLHWDPTVDAVGSSLARNLNVWFHDEPADYKRIDDMIQRVKDLFDALAAAKNGGSYITCIEWQGDSGDLEDDQYQTICRNSSFRVVGSGA